MQIRNNKLLVRSRFEAPAPAWEAAPLASGRGWGGKEKEGESGCDLDEEEDSFQEYPRDTYAAGGSYARDQRGGGKFGGRGGGGEHAVDRGARMPLSAPHTGAAVLYNKQTGRLERGPAVVAPVHALQDSPLHSRNASMRHSPPLTQASKSSSFFSRF